MLAMVYGSVMDDRQQNRADNEFCADDNLLGVHTR